MNLDPFFVWLESTPLSQWIVGSPSLLAFPGILSLHAIGMGFAVGISVMLDLRILGVASGVPIGELRRFLPILWLGFWVNAVSGVLLLIGYPTKALTNPVFYLKLTLIAVAMVLLVRICGRVFGPADGTGSEPDANVHPQTSQAQSPVQSALDSPAVRRMAMVSLLCWAAAITAGRLLAYTYSRLTAFS